MSGIVELQRKERWGADVIRIDGALPSIRTKDDRFQKCLVNVPADINVWLESGVVAGSKLAALTALIQYAYEELRANDKLLLVLKAPVPVYDMPERVTGSETPTTPKKRGGTT